MCNLYALTTPQAALRDLFDVTPAHDRLGNQPPLPAIFPRGEAPVVRPAPPGGEDGAAADPDAPRELAAMRWGFPMPQRSKRTGEPILPKAVNNARDDKLTTSPFWRESFERRRCLVPATAFCEAQGRRPAVHHWFALPPGQHEGGGGGGDEGDAARPPFAMAGLWRRWRGEIKGEAVDLLAYTVVTTTPNAVVAPVHPDRMVAILDPADWQAWLTAPPDEALRLIRPWPAERLRAAARGEGLTRDG